MNPIHESGFASLIVLFFATGPAALAALIALILAWKRPKAAIIAANVTIVLASLVCLLAAITTSKLHSRVDYWIDLGSYGPPADIHAKYGADWHASARLTAWAGLVFTALPFAISGLTHVLAMRKDPEIKPSVVVFVLGGLAVFSCLLMAIL
jgi:hypothetical protein